MNRIVILGCCGAGKSTLARKLHDILELELIHLDQHYWKPHWVESDHREWEETVRRLVNKERWIIDGNYGGTLDIRLERADTVLFLNYSTLKCLVRVITRMVKYWGKVRPDMPAGCPERFDFSFLHYAASFNHTKAKRIISKLERLKNTKCILILNSDVEAEKFITELRLSNQL